MSTEVGAKCGLIAADETTIAYLNNETLAKGPFEPIHPEIPFQGHWIFVQGTYPNRMSVLLKMARFA